LSLKILKDWVMEPTVVKTVSKDNVSALVDNEASWLVINEFFLHEAAIKIKKNITRTGFKLIVCFRDTELIFVYA
jgi:hypothetical protein